LLFPFWKPEKHSLCNNYGTFLRSNPSSSPKFCCSPKRWHRLWRTAIRLFNG